MGNADSDGIVKAGSSHLFTEGIMGSGVRKTAMQVFGMGWDGSVFGKGVVRFGMSLWHFLVYCSGCLHFLTTFLYITTKTKTKTINKTASPAQINNSSNQEVTKICISKTKN